MPSFLRFALLVSLLLQASPIVAEDWPRFRGPGGAATSEDRGLPATWSDKENIVWKTALPGFGTSSPIVVGERVFLTCYSGYGLDAMQPGNEDDLKRHLLCLDRSDGRIVWTRDVPATPPEANYIDFLVLHGYASSTPTSDGQRVYCCFGKSGTRAYDLNGQVHWQTDVGSVAHYWGSASSPVLLGELLLVNAAVEDQSLVVLNKHTGREVWRCRGLISSWSTPVVVDLPDGKQEIVLCIRSKLVAVDPTSGEQLWTVNTNQSYAAPSPIAHAGRVYAFAGRPNRLLCIRPGGRGDVTESHVVWSAAGVGSGITSPVLYGEHIYSVDDRGIAGCVKAATGEVLYTKRLTAERQSGDSGGINLYASPAAADGKIFAVSREQGAFVLAAGPEFKQLAHNRLDDSVFNASPTIHRGQLLLRSNRFVYCIGVK